MLISTKLLNLILDYFQSHGWYLKTFSETLGNNEADWEGCCLVQRIEPVRLSRSGSSVRLTFRASSLNVNGDAYIDRISISQADPDAGSVPGKEKYDSAPDLVLVDMLTMLAPLDGSPPGPMVIPAGNTQTLYIDVYNLAAWQPLLIAVDFSYTPPSAVKCTKNVPLDQACAYYSKGAWAAKPDRSALTQWTQWPGIYLIEKIEVTH
jgi:hypothetical protein